MIAHYIIFAAMALLAFFPTIMDIKKTIWKWILFGIFILLACIGGYANYRVEQREQIDTEKQRRDDQRNQENTIKRFVDIFTRREFNTKDLEEITTLLYKDIYRSSPEDAKKWAQNLISSSSEKQEEIKSISAKGEELGSKLLLKWQPLYTVILKEFDDRIYELERKNMVKSLKQDSKQSIVTVNKVTTPRVVVRKALFPNGHSIEIFLFPAEVKNGKLINKPAIRFEEYINEQYYDSLFLIRFELDSVKVSLFYQTNSFATRTDARCDEEFRTKLTNAIAHSIELVYFNDKQRKQ
jgi:hypothetical protein